MNREILFRGKLIDGGRWVYGSLLVFPDGECYVAYEGGLEDGLGRAALKKDPVVRESVGQLTGLKGKDGKDIYEGDIIKITESYDGEASNSEVRFFKGVFGVDNWTKGTKNECLTTLNHFMPTKGLYDDEQEYIVEVIGNIHDNPSLLKE